MKTTILRRGWVLLMAWLLTLLADGHAAAQASTQVVHLAKLETCPAQLESYWAALKEPVEAVLRAEPGVPPLYPVADARAPTHITVLEIHASPAAYRAHLRSPHLLKYKSGARAMVRSPELIEAVPPLLAVKVSR